MNYYLKWLIITSVIICAIIAFESNFNGLLWLAEQDFSYLCYTIWGVFALGVITAAYNRTQRVTAELADFSTKLGLLGTVIGMVFTFSVTNDGSMDLTDPNVANEMQLKILSGLAVAFSTTITGLVSSLLLGTYHLILKENKDA